MEDYFSHSENPSDAVHGIAFTVSSEDLIKSDQFESNTKNSNNIAIWNKSLDLY
jgi:hypothetical protein